jgi:hypothetical protein
MSEAIKLHTDSYPWDKETVCPKSRPEVCEGDASLTTSLTPS